MTTTTDPDGLELRKAAAAATMRSTAAGLLQQAQELVSSAERLDPGNPAGRECQAALNRVSTPASPLPPFVNVPIPADPIIPGTGWTAVFIPDLPAFGTGDTIEDAQKQLDEEQARRAADCQHDFKTDASPAYPQRAGRRCKLCGIFQLVDLTSGQWQTAAEALELPDEVTARALMRTIRLRGEARQPEDRFSRQIHQLMLQLLKPGELLDAWRDGPALEVVLRIKNREGGADGSGN